VERDREDPLSSVTLEDFNNEFAVNVTSAVFAAQEAVRGFKQLPSSASRTFIETGNKLNTIAIPKVFAFGIGKNASAHMIQCASMAYQPQGFK
jgi:NAD(P)-dependent dehydrogenase (short-subunit alcohol dehydrogenase family)